MGRVAGRAHESGPSCVRSAAVADCGERNKEGRKLSRKRVNPRRVEGHGEYPTLGLLPPRVGSSPSWPPVQERTGRESRDGGGGACPECATADAAEPVA